MNKDNAYVVYYYKNNQTNKAPVLEYVLSLGKKDKAKVLKYIEFLKQNKGYLEEPYSKHIKGKIRELRVDFSRNRHRVFYFTFSGKKIILLHAFLKKRRRTPRQEINRALKNLIDFEINQSFTQYEQKK